ncbi:MAG: hypothetical protein JO287_27430, partial [Pseudonocardiales bacterium]|nr:hypothetical protein [Pseudonocardiales bacterium]
NPFEIAITPDGKTAHVTNFGDLVIEVLDTEPGFGRGPGGAAWPRRVSP